MIARLLTGILAILLLGTPAAFAGPDPLPGENWKTDFSKISVPSSEIRSGGPRKDGIPSIDDPQFVAIGEAGDIADNEPVIGFELNGDARAYPLSVLMWHEVANDTVGGVPVAVTYCPLCNAAIVFDARHDGKPLEFGTTGRLRKSDLLMYDRQTESWWQQFSGKAIVGDLVGSKLKVLPSRLESFTNFKARFPDGKVLVPNNPDQREYGLNPYVGYDTLARPFLYSGPLPDDFPAMARVIVVRREGAEPLIVSMESLREVGTLDVEGHTFAWQAGQASALDTREIASGREVGNVVVTDSASGDDVAYDVTFAFVAHAFHPETAIRK